MATTPKARTSRQPAERRFALHGIRWRTYEALLRDLEAAGSNVQLTYDRGSLEFMSPGFRHERSHTLIGRMIEAMTEELNIPICSGCSTTFRRKLKKRGLEPDECYWIAHEVQVRGKEKIDLGTDPPPDLVVEVEYTSTILDKLGVYAALRFPEIWRFDGKVLRVAHLQADRTYREVDRSPSFPFLPMAEVARFLGLATETDETTWIRSFRAWVHDQIAPGFGEAADAGPHP